jgi:hypothetical protein
LREKGEVPTVTGADWTAETLRDILLRPRNAGFMVNKGKILEGVEAPWDPIVTPEVFFAVRELLADEDRRSGPGAAPRWHGSGIYRCGLCTPPGSLTAAPVTCEVTGGSDRQPRERCKDRNHQTRNPAHVDRRVYAHGGYTLTRPDAYLLLAPPAPEIDAQALRDEKAAIRGRLERLAVQEMLGEKTAGQVNAATRAGMARLAEIDELLNVNVVDDPLAAVLNAPDPVAAWRDAGLANQRVLIDRICTVTIPPPGARDADSTRRVYWWSTSTRMAARTPAPSPQPWPPPGSRVVTPPLGRLLTAGRPGGVWGGQAARRRVGGRGGLSSAAMVSRCSAVSGGQSSTVGITCVISRWSRRTARSVANSASSESRGAAIAASRARISVRSPAGTPADAGGGVPEGSPWHCDAAVVFAVLGGLLCAGCGVASMDCRALARLGPGVVWRGSVARGLACGIRLQRVGVNDWFVGLCVTSRLLTSLIGG